MKKTLNVAALAAFAVAISPATAEEFPQLLTQSGINFTGATPDWTGGYAGGSLSYTSGQAIYCSGFDGDEYDCGDPDDRLPTPSPEGGTFGITGGYDWQNGTLVYGVAGDLMIGNLSDGADNSDDPSYGCGVGDEGCGLEVSNIAMLRGRIGYATGDFLPYITAGVAVTQAAAFGGDRDPVGGTYTNAVIGVGAEYLVSETLSAGFDVMQIIEGDHTIIFDDFCLDCGPTHFSATLARFTLAYRF